jgi:hypothetical protein
MWLCGQMGVRVIGGLGRWIQVAYVGGCCGRCCLSAVRSNRPDGCCRAAVQVIKEVAVPASILIQRLDAAALLCGAALQRLHGSTVSI